MMRWLIPLLFFVLPSPCNSLAQAKVSGDAESLAKAENVYVDLSDAKTVVESIDSGLFKSYQGKDRAGWAEVYRARRKELPALLSRIRDKILSPDDSHALASMRAQLESFPADLGSTHDETRGCADAQRKGNNLSYPELRRALVECFAENDRAMRFEGKNLNRQTALDLLSELEEPERRKALFMAFDSLWKRVNANNDQDGPYRRLMALAADDASKNGSEIDYAARDLGQSASTVERWLEQILDAWRESSGEQLVEPWDFSFQRAAADRMLASRIPLSSLRSINRRFYLDLGVDLEHSGVFYDLEARNGRIPVSETEFITHGRTVNGVWRPATIRVSASYTKGGLPALNELVHENGHVVNLMAIRNRPAFSDWPSDLFSEAFADVPAWSVYEPAWQRKYLGQSAPQQTSLRALYASVALDAAWSLFELRMLRNPSADPNALWTQITNRYLHIVPHPELSWWALRLQLVDSPGYMVNYGLGAVLTAEMRQQIRNSPGPFDTGDARWYGWLSQHLLQYGSERDTQTLMKDLLGRPVSPEALILQIRRLRPPSAPTNDALQ